MADMNKNSRALMRLVLTSVLFWLLFFALLFFALSAYLLSSLFGGLALIIVSVFVINYFGWSIRRFYDIFR